MYIIKEDKLETSQHEIIEQQSDDGEKQREREKLIGN